MKLITRKHHFTGQMIKNVFKVMRLLYRCQFREQTLYCWQNVQYYRGSDMHPNPGKHSDPSNCNSKEKHCNSTLSKLTSAKVRDVQNYLEDGMLFLKL